MSEREKPLITTIIPTYRRPKLLRRAIKSVLNQTYPHFQVCVYDNASGDETAEVVAEFAKEDIRVKYHCHPENIGAIKNFNYGMEHVNTPFFSFLSDDDILLPEFYQTALEGFEKYPAAMFSATRVAVMNSNGNILGLGISDWKDGFYQPPEGFLMMLKCEHPTWTGIIFRKEIIEKVGILDQEIYFSDLDFEFRAATRCSFVISKKTCAIFFCHTSIPPYQKVQFILPDWLKMIRNLAENEQIPSDHFYAEQLTKQLKQNILRTAIISIIRRDFEDSYSAVDAFRNCLHDKSKALLLFILTKTCDCFFPVYYMMTLLYKIRKSIRSFLRKVCTPTEESDINPKEIWINL